LALVEHRRGNRSQARQWFEKASQWIERETNERTQGTMASRMSWEERLEVQLFHGEAMLALATRPGNGPAADHPVESSQ
jgi:hypothetical protein